MLEQVLYYLKNWFVVSDGMHTGTYTVGNGCIVLPFLQDGQYFRVVGSVFNDGLHQYPAKDMTDETFDGAILALAIPKSVISLSKEISAWQEKNGAAALSPYTSESFGGYSYSKAVDATTGGALTWESAFRSRLSRWRKI